MDTLSKLLDGFLAVASFIERCNSSTITRCQITHDSDATYAAYPIDETVKKFIVNKTL